VSALHFFDADILLYSISRADDEAAKRERAVALLDEDGGALSVQVLQEFYVQATRLTRPDPLPHPIAAGLIRTWMRFEVQDITTSVFTVPGCSTQAVPVQVLQGPKSDRVTAHAGGRLKT
jgi:predicted nucleic acid-binding protein